MRVLVACEESQRVCISFRELGHEAFSCDLQECSGGHPEWHIRDNVLNHLQDGWDLMVAHPPCTFLTVAGAWLYTHRDANKRKIDGFLARDFFMELLNANIEKICVENPVPLKMFNLPNYSQIIHPYMFGDPYTKRTCLWLKGLEPLSPANIVVPECSYMQKAGNAKKRSKTFWGIARAMAAQWGGGC